MFLIIKFYQHLAKIKEQILFSVFGYVSVCKHNPSCSQYAIVEIKKHGTIVGLIRALWRIISCW
ncbi:MAG: membrane protein insertion efficiency factor YidD [Candidatus Woesebacteria bacterium]|jgi:putative component of membrane protein insertase Oxa1/YidC/SpoIIIJ protein YidD